MTPSHTDGLSALQTAASGLGPGVTESACKPSNSCFSVCSPLGLRKQAPLVLKTDAWRACLSEAGVKSWELGVGYEPFTPWGESLGLRSFLLVGGWANGKVYGKTAPVHPAGLTVGLRFCADADELLSGCAGPFWRGLFSKWLWVRCVLGRVEFRIFLCRHLGGPQYFVFFFFLFLLSSGSTDFQKMTFVNPLCGPFSWNSLYCFNSHVRCHSVHFYCKLL